MKMDAKQSNGPIQSELKDCGENDQEVSGKVKVLVHQDAFDVPEEFPKRNNGSGDRHNLLSNRTRDIQTKTVEHDDVITPLSEESSSTITGHVCEDKLSVEPEDSYSNSCIQNLFPCWGTLIDPSSMTVEGFLCLIISFLFYVANIATDIAVCYFLYLHGNWLWFGLVVAFAAIPTVILNCISYHLSISKRIVKHTIWNQRESFVISVVIALLHLSQFGVFARYLGYIFLHELEYLWVVFCPASKQKYFNHHSGRCIELPYMPYLFIVEAILQCLPQLIVQLYVFISAYDVLAVDTNRMLIISSVVTLLNLCRLLTLCKYLEKNFSISVPGVMLIYLWYIFTTISRVLAFTFFITRFLLAFAMLCIFHWVIMSFWAVSVLTPSVPCNNLKGCVKNLKKYANGLLFGLMYVLCFLRLKLEDDSDDQHVPTRYLNTFFYSVIFLENAVLAILWFVYSTHVWYSIPVLVLTFVSFFVGIFFMCMYYRYFHKNIINNSKRWKFHEKACIRRKFDIKC